MSEHMMPLKTSPRPPLSTFAPLEAARVKKVMAGATKTQSQIPLPMLLQPVSSSLRMSCLGRGCLISSQHGSRTWETSSWSLHTEPRDRDYRVFCKTDVKSYYDSIDHLTLMLNLHEYIGDRTIMGYVWQFLNRCVEWGGIYQDIRRGIPRAASLSPLLGAFYLLDLDRRMEGLGMKHLRYMDDILIRATRRSSEITSGSGQTTGCSASLNGVAVLEPPILG